MDVTGISLLDLIAGRRSRTEKRASSDLLSLIRGGSGSVKKAGRSLYDNEYTRSIEATKQRRAAEEADRNHLRDFRASQLTGDAAYDSRPDRVKKRERAERDYLFERFASSLGGPRRKTYDEVAGEVARDGVPHFAKSLPGKAVGYALTDRSGISGISAINGLGDTVGGIAGAVQGDGSVLDGIANARREAAANRGDKAHDVANNLQLWANHIPRGAGDVSRFAVKHLDWGTWGNSIESRLKARRHDIMKHNAQMRTKAVDDVITSRFADPTLRDTESGFGKFNSRAMGIMGELEGGTAVSGGAGKVSGAIGRGITTGAGRLGASAGNAVTHAARSAGVAPAWAQRAGEAAHAAVTETGNAVAFPFNAVGVLGNPRGSMRDPVTGKITPVGELARDGWGTVKAVAKPGTDAVRFLRHPVANARAAASYAKTHPWSATYRAATYPVRYGYGIGKGVVKTTLSRPMWYGSGVYGAADDARKGNYWDAAKGIGDFGVYGGLGKYWYVPTAIDAVRSGASAFGGGSENQGE